MHRPVHNNNQQRECRTSFTSASGRDGDDASNAASVAVQLLRSKCSRTTLSVKRQTAECSKAAPEGRVEAGWAIERQRAKECQRVTPIRVVHNEYTYIKSLP